MDQFYAALWTYFAPPLTGQAGIKEQFYVPSINIRGNSYRMKDHQNLLQSGSDRRRKRAAS